MPLKKLVVLISGLGSNLQAILDACQAEQLPAQVVAVISDQANAVGLQRAQQRQIPAVVKAKLAAQTRVQYDLELAELVGTYQPDWVILAGWMRLLSPGFLDQFPERVVNLHPALPSAFPGLHAIERAYRAFQQGAIQNTGVMVHLVPDEGVDCGPILGQTTVPIYAEDTLATLTARMQQAEHQLLINTLQKLL